MESINTLVLHRVVENNIENFEDISVKTFELILAKHPKSFLSIDNAFNNDCPISNPICLTFDDGFSSDVDVVLPMLKANNAIATFFIVCDYLNKDGYMTNDQVVQLSNNNMQIGSHSLTHPNFVDLPLRFKKDEFRSSKIFLELNFFKLINIMHPVTQSTLVKVSNTFSLDDSVLLLYCFFSFSLNTPEDEKDLS